jgi:hypothetical protein
MKESEMFVEIGLVGAQVVAVVALDQERALHFEAFKQLKIINTQLNKAQNTWDHTLENLDWIYDLQIINVYSEVLY